MIESVISYAIKNDIYNLVNVGSCKKAMKDITYLELFYSFDIYKSEPSYRYALVRTPRVGIAQELDLFHHERKRFRHLPADWLRK